MKTIIDYKILYWSDSDNLSSDVRKHIKEGWQPLGHAQLGGDTYGFRYIQTMVKYEP